MSEKISNPPDAASLMTSARSFGNYDLAGAIADLIDNSITAGASRIEISCEYGERHPEIRIRDDGCGMTEPELRNAMRPASTNPDAERSADDLGRFGWGMKSASFSQCKKLTVVSKKGDVHAGACWDLDDIDDWSMMVYPPEEAAALLMRPMSSDSGTELIWQKCDRFSELNTMNQEQFNEAVNHARRRLSLIFHRFISGHRAVRKIHISLNNTGLDPLDPFYEKHPATQAEPRETIMVGETKVIMQAYTLPHYSKLDKNEYEVLGGEEGYVKNQGFYVYRNNRLIIYGTWFRLAKHGELSKLVRISIDIPNSLDSMWKITIDKSDAQLPSALRQRMKTLVDGFREKSTRVFRSKGGKIGDGRTVTVWERYAKHQSIRYRINRKYPVIETLKRQLDDGNRRYLDAVLDLIETEFPIDTLFSDTSASPHRINQGHTDPEKFAAMIREIIPVMLARYEDVDTLVEKLRTTEPFKSNWSTVENYLHERKIM